MFLDPDHISYFASVVKQNIKQANNLISLQAGNYIRLQFLHSVMSHEKTQLAHEFGNGEFNHWPGRTDLDSVEIEQY